MVAQLPVSSARAALAALANGDFSAVELTQACLHRIGALNPHIQAFRDVIAERALEDASRADERRRRGGAVGSLDGLPIAIKENVDTTPARCPAGLSFRHDYRPTQDAAVTAALRGAGAVVLGVTVSDPGAFGVRTAEVTHPQQPSLSAGGSSGGSGAALAAELCFGTIGTDTGGSIRVPSACCAIAGLKPTRERVSLDGVFPLVWSLDHVGPMAKTVADVDLLAATLDPTGFAAPPRLGRKIVGYDPGYFADAEQVVREDFESVLAACRDLGYIVTEVSLPKPNEVLPVHGKIFSIESYAFYNSTYPDALREYPTLAADMFAYAQSLGPETYVLAMRQRAALTQRVQAVLDEVDFVLTPTLPLLRPIKDAEGFMIGDQWVEFTFALVRYTCLFDHTGHPVLAMPMGIQGPGLATSVQVIGPLGGDQAVVQFGAELESALALNVDRGLSDLA